MCKTNKPVAARRARYSKSADWEYIAACARATAGALPLVGNGDVVSLVDYYARLTAAPELATIMLARGALVKPWIFTEARRARLVWPVSLLHAGVLLGVIEPAAVR